MESVWKNPFVLEMRVADIISRQAKHGTQFNARKAKWYVHTLTEEIIKIDLELIPLLPKMLNVGTEYKKPFKANGQFMKYVQIYADNQGLQRHEVGGPFTAMWYSNFDPGKTARVKAVMLDMGWIPTEWNEKKTPFQVFRYRKKLEKSSYQEFCKKITDEQLQEFEEVLNPYIASHFKDKSKNYMKAFLIAIGFDVKQKAPTFGQIKKKLLMKQFWPTSPKITEDSFDSLNEDEGRALTLLKERMMRTHRRSLLEGLIEQVREDGKLSGEANPCATPTARMRHKIIVNIPAAGAFFGKQCRSLFTGDYNGKSEPQLVVKLTQKMIDSGAFRRKPGTNIMQEWNSDKSKWDDCGYCNYLIPRGYDGFVGGDGAGLELRMLTHYLVSVSQKLLHEAEENNDQRGIEKYSAALRSAIEYREVLLNGDIHSHNQRLAGLPTRKSAKTFIYAFLYGAGDANLGGQLGEGKEKGAELRARFLKECPCIPVLIEWVQEHAKTHGWVPAIDGRMLIMRRDPNSGEVMAHKALNTMLQAAGSIVMKVAGVFLDNWMKRDSVNAHQVIMMHDEYQFTCQWEHIPHLRELIDNCVARAGIYFKMDCPLASDSMLGANWYHTH